MNTDHTLEFDKVKQKWKDLALSDAARQKIEEASYSLNEVEVRKEIKDTTDARTMIEQYGAPPLTSVDETKDIVALSLKGSCLLPGQLERVEKALVAAERMKKYLQRGKQQGNSLAYYEMNLDSLEELRQEIARQIRNQQVDDHASKLLLQLRRELAELENQMRLKAEQMIRTHKECMADSFMTHRAGRVCVPVKKEYKWKIPGSVIDKSSTGNTLFVEPLGIANIYEKLQMLKIEEENEVHRILYTLTAMVAESAEVIAENIRVTEKLDFIFSKGKLSQDMDAAEPKINVARQIDLKNARHPLMDKELCVPLDIELGTHANGIIITGPNTGGKTVALKTTALNCLMAQTGLHVTCEEADICMNSAFLCDIGDGQNLTENLSTFSAHIKNVLEIVASVNKESLVIMDELGSGTDPTEGMGIAISILEELRKSGCLFLATTHYPEVKEYASRTEDVINARMEFDRESLKPTYQLKMGEAGESCAFYIAEKLGMPARMLKTAVCASYGKEAAAAYQFQEQTLTQYKVKQSQVKKRKPVRTSANLSKTYQIGDSVMVLPDKKIGIVCEEINEKGVLRVQLPNKKVWINHKRVKLHIAAKELYPEDYDFSIIFDTVENRKARHEMERKYTTKEIWAEEE